MTPSPAPKLYTLADLRAANLPEPQPIAEGFLNEGETILLVGRPKVGKSRLLQQLTLDLSRGLPFLGTLRIPHPRRVLLLDLENRPCGVKKRFEAMAPAEQSDDQIFVYAPETLAAGRVDSTPAGIAELVKLLSQTNPDVLIIDTWRLFVGGDENSPEVIVKALKALSSIRMSRLRLAIILVHHLRKEKFDAPTRLREDPFTWVESVSGHHALVGHVDACYGLEREMDQGEELIVFGGVARNALPSALLLEEDDQTLRFAVRSGEDAARAAMTEKERDFWVCAKTLGKFTFTDLVKAAKTTNKKTVTSMLRKAVSHQVLRKEGLDYVIEPWVMGGTSGTI